MPAGDAAQLGHRRDRRPERPHPLDPLGVLAGDGVPVDRLAGLVAVGQLVDELDQVRIGPGRRGGAVRRAGSSQALRVPVVQPTPETLQGAEVADLDGPLGDPQDLGDLLRWTASPGSGAPGPRGRATASRCQVLPDPCAELLADEVPARAGAPGDQTVRQARGRLVGQLQSRRRPLAVDAPPAGLDVVPVDDGRGDPRRADAARDRTPSGAVCR